MDNYPEKVFLGVGIPYNKDLISLEEIGKIGERIRKIHEDACWFYQLASIRQSCIQRTRNIMKWSMSGEFFREQD